jgi:hypothetical protein
VLAVKGGYCPNGESSVSGALADRLAQKCDICLVRTSIEPDARTWRSLPWGLRFTPEAQDGYRPGNCAAAQR